MAHGAPGLQLSAQKMEPLADALTQLGYFLFFPVPHLLPVHYCFHLCATDILILVPAALVPLQLCPFE